MSDTERGHVRRTVVFAAALALLLAVARAGSPTPVLQLCLILFVIAATLWIRGQYLDSLDHVRWLVPWRAAVVLGVVAAGLLISHFFLAGAGAALAGVLVLYFLAGSGLVWWRQSERAGPHRTRAALLLLGAGAVLALAGLLVLGRGAARAWIVLELVLLGAGFLVLLPLGLALLAESGVRRACVAPARHRLIAGLSGLLLYAAALTLVGALSGSPWLLGALLVLALLVVAMVSMTQADIAAAMCVIALLGVTPLPAEVPPEMRPGPAGGRLLVAFGDSYMSGEGASIYYRGTDEGGGNQCRRSPTAWAAMAGQQRPFDRVEFLACSGARTVNVQSAARPVRPGAPAPEPQAGEPATQLDRYLASHGTGTRPSLVVLGIGGNDAGFSTIGMMCLAPGNCGEQSRLWTDALPQVQAGLRDTYRQIDAVFPDTPVAVVPYPDPIAATGRCADVSLSARERVFLHDFVTGGLNRAVAATAAEFGFHYLGGMQSALADAHLQLCDERNQGRPGLHFIGIRSVRGAAEQRFNPANMSHSSLHPNERGHAALLRSFESWLPQDVDTLRPRLTARPASDATLAAAAGQPAAVPPCDVLDPSPAGCRPRGMQWAKQQVSHMLLTQGWLALAALAGSWLAAVAFFGDRRHRLPATAAGKAGPDGGGRGEKPVPGRSKKAPPGPEAAEEDQRL